MQEQLSRDVIALAHPCARDLPFILNITTCPGKEYQPSALLRLNRKSVAW